MSVFQDVTYTGQADGNVVHFFYREKIDPLKTREKGRPIHKSVPYVTVQSPGQSKSKPTFEITENKLREWRTDDSKREYLELYEKFKNAKKPEIEGTLLTEWPQIDRTTAKNLSFFRIVTVENLAAVSDANLSRLGPGGRALRERARAFLKGDSKREAEAQLAEERKRNEELTRRVEKLEKLLENRDEPSDDMPGRSGGDGRSGTHLDSGQRKPDRNSDTGAGKKKPKRGRPKASVAGSD